MSDFVPAFRFTYPRRERADKRIRCPWLLRHASMSWRVVRPLHWCKIEIVHCTDKVVAAAYASLDIVMLTHTVTHRLYFRGFLYLVWLCRNFARVEFARGISRTDVDSRDCRWIRIAYQLMLVKRSELSVPLELVSATGLLIGQGSQSLFGWWMFAGSRSRVLM